MHNDSAGEEPETWAAAVEGDASSFGLVYDRHRNAVYRHALRVSRSVTDAEDITAMAFVELWNKRRAVRIVNGSVLPWLVVTTIHVASNLVRSRNRYALALARLPPPESREEPSAAVDARLDRAALYREVGLLYTDLSPIHKDVVALCVLEELSHSEAAAVLRVPVGTVKSRLTRAKAALAAGLSLDNPFAEKGDSHA